LANDNEATSEGPTPQKRKAGRPKKAPDNSAMFEQMQRQINTLQNALLQRGAEDVEKQKATLAPVPAPTEELKPGTYVEIGKDSSGAPIIGKVHWTRAFIEKTYAPVTFTPNRSMDLGPHGVQYHVYAEQECTVPSIVKDFYDAAIRTERNVQAATKPLSSAEIGDVDARANENPGTKQYSRLYRTAGGLNVRGDAEPEPTN